MVAGESEPVLVELSVPKRVVERGLVDGLVVPAGQFTGERRLDPALPDERIADFLAEAAHRPDGFVARAEGGAQALAVLAGTVAALCGEDIRKALNSPDTAFLAGLSNGAADAVREILLGIESDTPVETERALRAALRPAETGG
ncbi:hypothetical protein [Nocardia flavorosea]|uniref:Uncharacterized protein n=1 Tax=Nocardia flavorosea TaxID=53429 RepID=A0A846YBM9_9NOCA|nr:hypothetical protein [Nocardia flavorosea]NKY56257.1 hypothetical protein [Nocardia flavorosea]